MLTKGRLLVAAPLLADPNFDRTVVLMVEHSQDGALGLVLNRPSEHDVAGILHAWAALSAPPPVIFAGGPVEPGGLVGLAQVGRISGPLEGTAGFTPVLDGLGTVDLSLAPSEIEVPLASVRLFAGHAGWGPQQLDGELDVGAWIVVDALPDDGFDPQPAGLWRRVLARQAGTLAWLADYPQDVLAN